MPRYASDQNTKLTWVTSISNTSAPTAAELKAGTDLSLHTRADGVNIALSQNMVDSATIADLFDSQGVGTYGGSATLTMFRNTTDTAWNMIVYATTGYLVV